MITVPIKGDVVDDDTADFYDFFEMQCTSPKKVNQILSNANGQDITVEIASNGGDVFAGSEIYSALKGYSGKVIVNILGLAASIASVVAMAGDEVNIAPTAQIMIHQAWSSVDGNADDMEHQSDVLQQIDQSIINAYEAKTGLNRDELLRMMSNETWLTAQNAVDKHFADGIMFADSNKPSYCNSIGGMVSHSALNKFRNMKYKLQEMQKEKSDSAKKDNLTAEKLKILRGE